jgi:hypothetical protein
VRRRPYRWTLLAAEPDAEPVSLRVAQDGPPVYEAPDLPRFSLDESRSEPEQPLDLGLAVLGAEVEMDRNRLRRRLRVPLEEKPRAGSLGRHQHRPAVGIELAGVDSLLHLVQHLLRQLRPNVAEGGLPELGELDGVRAGEGYVLDLGRSRTLVLREPAPPADEREVRLRLQSWLEREAALVGVACLYAVVVLLTLPQQLVQDSWLTLASGREIVRHGLPSHDMLAVWTHGREWVDQQWLAQLAFYGLDALGGLRLVLLGHALLLVSALVLGLVLARRAGASARSVALVALAAMLVAPWALQLRAQSFAPLLFVALVGLLAADSRAPSRRVLWTLPLLVLWANLHGTVVLGAALVAWRGVTSLPRLRALPLLAAPLCVFASPYGLALAGYYRRLLVNPLLPSFLEEWRSSAPSQRTALFFVLTFAAVWLVARHGRALTLFERGALLLTLLSALAAIRSIVWFGFACLVLLPPLVDRALPRLRLPAQRAFAVGGAVAVGAVAVFTVARPVSSFLRDWPAGAAHAVSEATLDDPSARVFADDRTADWLLWEDPSLAGRLAYDVRFELFDDRQFERLLAFRNRAGDDWRRAASGYRVLTLDPRAERSLERALLAEPGARLVYRAPGLDVLLRPQRAELVERVE